ncbi:glutathione-independent formaldehyde dehydrogenase [Moniliophthora roreri MCA 2997]|uniref:Glutathione-independent formaldehyde dehydrogenase n=1 Tax=Moniliophthora roreri (strain MCA 2997) TaxID=1381753 RepID=V2XVB6_MONRO|nr:glutathione-independent formaldehyde dehydrogenase [Moniliophthora roreri MCA 2997]
MLTRNIVWLNRPQSLCLAERCVEILLSVREEVEEAGDRVMEELGVPISKLTESELSNKSKLPEVRRSPATRQITRSATSSRGWMGVIGDVDGVPVGAIGSKRTRDKDSCSLTPSLTSFDYSKSTSTTNSVATVTAPALAPASAPPTLPTTVSETDKPQALFTDFNTFKLPAGTEHEGFALLADIFHTGWHGVQVSGFRPGETIVVSGAEDVELIATYSAV